MKKKSLFSYVIFIIIFIFGLYIYYLNNKIINYQKQLKELEYSVNDKFEEKDIKKDYDCSFTETWRIVNNLDNYIAEVPELSYIIVDKFQSHSAYSYYIPSNLKIALEENKYYEFTYTLKGNGIINNMEDIYYNMIKTYTSKDSPPSLKVMLEIKETNKLGMEQLNEPICK